MSRKRKKLSFLFYIVGKVVRRLAKVLVNAAADFEAATQHLAPLAVKDLLLVQLYGDLDSGQRNGTKRRVLNWAFYIDNKSNAVFTVKHLTLTERQAMASPAVCSNDADMSCRLPYDSMSSVSLVCKLYRTTTAAT